MKVCPECGTTLMEMTSREDAYRKYVHALMDPGVTCTKPKVFDGEPVRNAHLPPAQRTWEGR